MTWSIKWRLAWRVCPFTVISKQKYRLGCLGIILSGSGCLCQDEAVDEERKSHNAIVCWAVFSARTVVWCSCSNVEALVRFLQYCKLEDGFF